jgi:hypothetical protein
MKLERTGMLSICCFLVLTVIGCVPGWITSEATLTPEWQAGLPREGQPAFPSLGQYWVIDNGCGFNQEKVQVADSLFEELRLDGIAEVAVICQTGIVDNGGINDEKIWLRDWARWAKMGSIEDSRAVVWLIRPDVRPEDQRVSIEISRWLYWYTAINYVDSLQEAANFANEGDFNSALVSIARNTDEELRQLWITHQPAPTGTVAN